MLKNHVITEFIKRLCSNETVIDEIETLTTFNQFLDNRPKLLSKIQHKFQLYLNQIAENEMHVENPNDDESDIFYKQASQLYKEKKYDESLRIYDKSLEINPNNAQSLNGKGLCLIKKDENEKAVQIFNQAISLSNNDCNSDFIYNKSLALNNLPDYKNAIDALKFASGLSPTIKKYYATLGFVYIRNGLMNKDEKNFKSALESFDKAIAIDQSKSKYYFGKSDALFLLSDYKNALNLINKAIEIDSNKGEYFFKKAQILNELNEYSQAILCLENAISLGSKNKDYPLDLFYSDLGYIYFNSKKLYKALECFEEASKLNPQNVDSYNGKGLVLNDREDGDKTDYLKAIKYYNTAIDLEPENAQFYFNKGISYQMLCRFNNEKSKKEFKLAIKCFNQAIKRDEKNINYYKQKAEIFMEFKKYEKAKQVYEKIIKIDSSLIDVKKRISICKLKLSCLKKQSIELVNNDDSTNLSASKNYSALPESLDKTKFLLK